VVEPRALSGSVSARAFSSQASGPGHAERSRINVLPRRAVSTGKSGRFALAQTVMDKAHSAGCAEAHDITAMFTYTNSLYM